jgi:hypothetical protein
MKSRRFIRSPRRRAQQEGYNSVPPLAVVFNLCDRRFDTRSGCMTWHLMKK